MPFDLLLAQKSIETALRELPLDKEPHNLYEPIRYFLALGGKRLRPAMTLLSASCYGVSLEKALKPALAVEIFHNFSLVHDDIMDNAPMRRSLPTVHEKWNRNIALLSGDLMLIEAYNCFLKLDAHILPVVLEKFNRCAAQVCEGQQWDMDFEAAQHITVEQYINMIGLKTAVLLGFAFELGAILAGEMEQGKTWQQIGYLAGIGFQLKDDLLDVFADQAQFGKQIGGDIIANKKTYLLIKSLQLAQGHTLEQINYWLNLRDFDPHQKVQAIKAIYQQLNIEEHTNLLIEEYFKAALEKIDSLNLVDKEPLRSFLLNLMQRSR